jgi:hypothetical protein
LSGPNLDTSGSIFEAVAGQPNMDGMMVWSGKVSEHPLISLVAQKLAGPKCSIDGPKRHVIFAQDGISIFNSQAR